MEFSDTTRNGDGNVCANVNDDDDTNQPPYPDNMKLGIKWLHLNFVDDWLQCFDFDDWLQCFDFDSLESYTYQCNGYQC